MVFTGELYPPPGDIDTKARLRSRAVAAALKFVEKHADRLRGARRVSLQLNLRIRGNELPNNVKTAAGLYPVRHAIVGALVGGLAPEAVIRWTYAVHADCVDPGYFLAIEAVKFDKD